MVDKRSAAPLAFLLVILAQPGLAAPDKLESEGRAACTHDAFVHCPLQALAADRSGVRDCLVSKLARLSSACRAILNDAHAQGGQTLAPAQASAAAESASPDGDHRSDR